MNHCPHCQTAVTDELKDVRREIMARDSEQNNAQEAGSSSWWKWGVGIVAGLGLIVLLKPDETPIEIEGTEEISDRLDDVVPSNIEEAREMVYEDARTNWDGNKAGPPSEAKVALAIQMVDDDALTDPELEDPKLRLARYKLAVTIVHCDNPTPCEYE